MVNTTATVSAASRSAIANSKVDGDDRVSEIITAAQTNDKTFVRSFVLITWHSQAEVEE